MRSSLDVEINDSALEPNGENKVIEHRKLRGGKRQHYRVFLYLTGADLPFVKEVSYRLHPTFKQQVRTVRRTLSNPNCQLVIWTWGLFSVRARIVTKDRRVHERTHQLSYDRDFDREDVSFVEL